MGWAALALAVLASCEGGDPAMSVMDDADRPDSERSSPDGVRPPEVGATGEPPSEALDGSVSALDAQLDSSDRADTRVVDARVADARIDGAPSGRAQHCAYAAGCLEFVNHLPGCARSNQVNCQNIFKGTYGEGECAGEFTQTSMEQTSCGLTLVRVR